MNLKKMTLRSGIGFSMLLLSCTLSTISSYTEPLAIWPLGNETLANEVKVGGTPASQNQQPGFSITTNNYYLHPFLSYIPAYLDGVNPLDLEVPTTIGTLSNSEFHLYFFVWTKHQDGSLIHYKTTNPIPSGITEFQIWLDSGHVEGNVKFSDDSDDNTVEIENNVFPRAVWCRIGIGVNKSNLNMIFTIYLNDVEALRIYTLHAGLDLDLPGILRLGSNFDDGDSNIMGLVTCVLLYGNANVGSVLDMQNECNSWNESKSNSYTSTTSSSTQSDMTTTSVPETTSLDISTPGIHHTTQIPTENLNDEVSTACNPVTTPFVNYDQMWKITSGYYIVLERDASPQLNPLFDAIMTFSLSACASHCLQDQGTCFAFTLTKSLEKHVCKLYGDVRNVPTQTVAGTNLYKLFHYANATSLNNC